MAINFKEWTDAQLNEAQRFIDGSPNGIALATEIARRKAENIWLTDGSTERVAKLIADNTPATRRKLNKTLKQQS